jgi:hypothetical protein
VDVLLVEGEEVVACDRGDRGVLRLARVRSVDAVAQLRRLAAGDALRLVVAARDGAVGLGLGEVDLLLAEGRVLQDVDDDGEDGVEVALQQLERDAR